MLVSNADELIHIYFSGIWSACTSETSDQWSPSNPSRGQAVITALAVQKYLGGDIASGTLHFRNNDATELHFWNVIDEDEIDVTYDQYADTKIRDQVFAGLVSKDAILANPDTRKRYEVFLEALKAHNPLDFFLTLKQFHKTGR